MSKDTFHGLRTAIYHAPDMDAARAWYTGVLGFAPYFDQPFYMGFNVGGYELGFTPDEGKGDGALVYWGVDDAATVYAALLAKGATEHSAVRDVGEGILVATVRDPFGNIFGVIQNPHFKL